ncbi:MAG: hypothetical protein ACK4S6_03160 [Roseateles asaccharophilus]|uniref:hypothetical protein n=1 Tax=Roseateles asaccharophilus TaxID=582607 RepID=UPI00391C3B60
MFTKKSVLPLFLLFSSLTAQAQVWQQSASPQVQLGIRDKGGVKGYVAEFIVNLPDGKTQSAKIQVEENEFGFVLYPSDFGGYMMPGKYTWKARVNGKDAIKGQFSFEEDANGGKLTVKR